jgi:Na+/H+ antiporter NhaA
MNKSQHNSGADPAHLPTEPIHRVTEPFARFFRIQAASAAILVVAIGYSDHFNWVALTIVAFSWLAVRLGIATRPGDMSWGVLAAGGLLAGVGFTMALFIADLTFDGSLLHSAKLGILFASTISAVIGLLLLGWLLPPCKDSP